MISNLNLSAAMTGDVFSFTFLNIFATFSRRFTRLVVVLILLLLGPSSLAVVSSYIMAVELRSRRIITIILTSRFLTIANIDRDRVHAELFRRLKLLGGYLSSRKHG